MSKIKDVIKINSGYESYVDLQEEFYYYDEDRNKGRMELYEPIKAHRIVFEKVANSINNQDRRVYFLSGSYGTGKSHLCLMLGNYFLNQSSMPEMKKFFKNYANAQANVKLKSDELLEEVPATTLESKRKNGRYLVAICRFGSNDFESTILRAVQEAINKDEAQIELDTYYKEAVRKLEEWEKRKSEKSFFDELIKYLKKEGTGWNYTKLLKELSENIESAMKIFKQAFKDVTSTDFTYSKDNLLDILKDTLKDEKFKEAYKGLVIIYDEFGYALDDGSVDIKLLHEFTQFCTKSGLQYSPCVFISTGHKPFVAHGEVGNRVHYSTLKDRFNEIPLQTEGIEGVIGAVVQQEKESNIWEKEVIPNTEIFTGLSKECKRLKIFSWLKAPVLKANIIENIYPMHPLATYALLQMAREFGSDNRSVIKFISPEFEKKGEKKEWKNVQKFSYPWFIEHNEIGKDGKLNLYTSNILVKYFLKDFFDRGSAVLGKTISLERIKKSISDYKETKESLNKYLQSENQTRLFDETDELMENIFDAMLVNEIISNDETPIVNNIKNIQFALNAISPQEKKAIKNRLEQLCKTGVIYLNNNGVYEFKPSDTKDIRRIVEEYIQNPSNKPADILDKFIEITNPDNFLDAEDYNTNFNEDKRLKIKFITPSEMDKDIKYQDRKITIFEKLEIEQKEIKEPQDRYEGTAIYVFCENEQGIDKAKSIIKNNRLNRVVVGIPKESKEVLEHIFKLAAIEHIKNSEDFKNFGHIENSQILEIEKEAKKHLIEVREKYFNNEYINWYRKNGEKITVNKNSKHSVADYLMKKLFNKKGNKIKHQYFNKIHSSFSSTNRRTVEQASNILIDRTKSIKFEWELADNRGAKRYLQNLFVNNQFLKYISTDGDYRIFNVEQDKSKFKNKIPAYDRMLGKIEEKTDKGSILCANFFDEFYEDYGQGLISVGLLLLLSRRYYGDSIRFKREEHALSDIEIESFDTLKDILTGQYSNSVIIIEKILNEEKEYFRNICKVFKRNGITEGNSYGISDAYKSITEWWNKQDTISHTEIFYEEEYKPFVKLLKRSDSIDPYIFIKTKILEFYNIQKGEKLNKNDVKNITDKIKKFKDIVEGIGDKQKKIIREKLSKIFNAEDNMDIDIQNAMERWYKQLDNFQKDPYSHKNDISRIFIAKIENLSNIQELIYKIYPTEFRYGNIVDWRDDNTDDYIEKIKSAKEFVEKNKTPVKEVNIDYVNNTKEEDSKVYYKGGLKIIPKKIKQKGITLFYTDDDSDPTEKNGKRKPIKAGDSIKITQGNKNIKIVAVDRDGNCSKVKPIYIIDETQKFLIKTPAQKRLSDTSVTFIFPEDKKSAEVSLRSYLNELIDMNILDKKSLNEIVNKLLKE